MFKFHATLVLATFPIGTLASILPFKYQSASLTFNDWVSLLTLCFAPLIAHVIAGVPIVVFRSQQRPAWYQQLALYNPATITWRYFAIADRRIRAKRWSEADMASSNVYFWTCKEWDGSEMCGEKSQAYIVTLPQSRHAKLLSGSTLKTIIVTLQGAQSLNYLIWSNFTTSNNNWNATLSISTLFSPLAVLGLLRLVACLWLTDDFFYANCEKVQTTVRKLVSLEQNERERVQQRSTHTAIQMPPMRMRKYSASRLVPVEEAYHGINTWQSWLFRTMFLIPILGLTALSIWNLIPAFLTGVWYTVTLFGTLLCYTIFMTTSSIIFGYYFIRGGNTTTIIPCISSTWYQAFTILLYISLAILFVTAALENWKAPCGLFTTFPSERLVCNDTIPVIGQC